MNNTFLDAIKKSSNITFSHKITTNMVQANRILLNAVPEKFMDELGTTKERITQLQTKSVPRVRQLFVRTINGIKWNEFYKSVYKKNAPLPIEGI